MMSDPDLSWPVLQRMTVRNYRSIGYCDVRLRPLTVMVGRNGAGKSNLVDALRFVADSLDSSLDHALKARGGIDEVRRRSTGHPHNFAIEVQLGLPGYELASYGFEIAARKRGGFVVKWERLKITAKDGGERARFIRIEGAVLQASEPTMPPVAEGRLYLANAAGLPAFREVYAALRAMGFYNLNPEAMKELQPPDVGDLLRRDGSNIASVVARLSQDRPELVQRVCDYLSLIVPGIEGVERHSLGPRETLLFRQEVKGAEFPWKFYAANMSDGTLRSLGALVVVMQLSGEELPVRLVGIEEPETALHPAAAGALMDALREASRTTQVLITTHSPELLDQVQIEQDGVLVVTAERGTTKVAPVDAASLSAIKEHLFSPGELLRLGQLEPDPALLLEQERQLSLFDAAVDA